jgi:hypothetical protein
VASAAKAVADIVLTGSAKTAVNLPCAFCPCLLPAAVFAVILGVLGSVFTALTLMLKRYGPAKIFLHVINLIASVLTVVTWYGGGTCMNKSAQTYSECQTQSQKYDLIRT